MKPGILLLIFVLVFIPVLVGCVQGQESYISELPRYIMHAGGVTPDGRSGTNSVEAMNTSYENGNYWLEIDFNQTSDGVWVCVHDWDAFYSHRVAGGAIPDLKTFEAHRASAYGFESPTLETLVGWIKKHQRAVIVTDVKENNQGFLKFVSENYPDYKDHFAVQIYSPDEYEVAAEYGFDKIIYTLYKENPGKRYDTEILSDFIESSENLIALTYAMAHEHAEDIAAICDLGIPVYIHTVNDDEEQSSWYDLGAYGFYSDYIEDADDK